MSLAWFRTGYKYSSHPSLGQVSCVEGGGYRWYCPGWWGLFWSFPTTPLLYWQGVGLRLRGKSFRWRRHGRTMVLRLGYAHAMAVRLPPQAHLGFASKSYIHVWGTSLAVLGLFTYALRGLREPNIYHGRGIRLSRQVLVRKHGKVSAYR